LTTESLMVAPAVYRKLLEPDPARPLWTESDDPLALPLPQRERPVASRWSAIAVGVAVAAIAVFGLFRLLNDRGSVEVLGVTTASSVPTTIPTAGTPAGTDATTTTEPATTTTTTTSSTTTTTLPPLTITPIGDPVPISELRLGAFALEPFEFGSSFGVVAGRLAASLEEPSEVSNPGISSGEFGTCAGDLIQTVRWGRLLIIGVEGPEGDLVFSGYRIDGRYDSFRFPVLRTISGIGVGDSVADLQSTYSTVRLATDDAEGPVFQVLSGGGDLLIWGPVNGSGADAEILGIYSPNSCQS
jgi:hypothetical protein